MRKFEIGVGQDFPVEEGRQGHRHHRRGHPHHHHHHRGCHGGHRKLVAILLMALGHRRGQPAPGQPAPERKTP